MRIAFISNFLSHHQIPFCNAMYKNLGKDYCFISTTYMDDERKNMGWTINERFPYEIKSYESEVLMRQAKEIVNKSDVVIIGSAPDDFIKERLINNKLTFRYSERLYKRGLTFWDFF